MDAPSNIQGAGTSVFVAVAAGIILAAAAGGWVSRTLLLRALKARSPDEFARLGNPSNRELGSLLPKHGELQIQFWKYLWGSAIFQAKDPLVSGLAVAARVSDVALVIGVVLLIGSAGK